jgi:transcriptional regulator with AAA-type ATPase domain
VGRFELANKGSIFLDEIGDLDPASQVKLLRVLQDRTFEPLGSSRSKTADVRIICATNRNLEEMVAKGTFREDLYYRINLITVRLPALRERPGDIPLLVEHFVANLRTIYGRPGLKVDGAALKWLKTCRCRATSDSSKTSWNAWRCSPPATRWGWPTSRSTCRRPSPPGRPVRFPRWAASRWKKWSTR